MELSDPKVSRLRRWHAWLVVAPTVAVLAFAGGALIGLAPWYTLSIVLATLAGGYGLVRWRHRAGERAELSRVVPLVVIAGVVVIGLIQSVPYGRAHSNPAPTGEPAWSSPRTRELMVRACYGCHSNEVVWPWYSNIAPISWAVTDHVEDGRDAVNYSEFATDRGDAEETIEVIEDGSMPPGYYTAFGLHDEANLTDAETAELLAGLRATSGLFEDDAERDERRSDDDSSDDDDSSG